MFEGYILIGLTGWDCSTEIFVDRVVKFGPRVAMDQKSLTIVIFDYFFKFSISFFRFRSLWFTPERGYELGFKSPSRDFFEFYLGEMNKYSLKYLLSKKY